MLRSLEKGTYRKSDDYRKFDRFYLEYKVAPLIVNYVGCSIEDALDAIGSALLFNDYNHLVSSYSLDDSKGVFRSEFMSDAPSHFYIYHNGFYFSEFILMKELGIGIKTATRIKKLIDYYYKPCAMYHHGNVTWSNDMSINQGIERIEYYRHNTNTKATRIMTEFPFRFYVIHLENKIDLKNGSQIVKPILNSDHFFPADDTYIYYLNNEEYMSNHAINIFQELSHRYDILFKERTLTSIKSALPTFFNHITDQYDYKEVSYSNWYGEGGLYISNQSLQNDVKISIKMSLGEKIKHQRKKLGYTQEDLADELNVSVRTISNWENSNFKPLPKNRSHLSEVLNVIIPLLDDD